MLCDLENLEPGDINLSKGIVLIRRNTKTKRRVLKLEASQVLLLQEYLTATRATTVKTKETGSRQALYHGRQGRKDERNHQGLFKRTEAQIPVP